MRTLAERDRLEAWHSAYSFTASISYTSDSPSERYQFPSQYLSRCQAFIGDWIVYYEPSKVAATRGYFAVARLRRSFRIRPSRACTWRSSNRAAIWNSPMRCRFGCPMELSNAACSTSRARFRGGLSVRFDPHLAKAISSRIINLGLDDEADDPAMRRLKRKQNRFDETQQAPFVAEETAGIVWFGDLTNRAQIEPFGACVAAYDQRCAITGLEIDQWRWSCGSGCCAYRRRRRGKRTGHRQRRSGPLRHGSLDVRSWL